MSPLNLNNLLGGLGIGMKLPTIGRQSKATQMPFMTHIGITDGDAAYDTMAEVLAIIGAILMAVVHYLGTSMQTMNPPGGTTTYIEDGNIVILEEENYEW